MKDIAVARAKTPVFINCPFDREYEPFFRATIFTILRCGFTPRCALEIIDGAGTRISKIEAIIESCKLGIHDISRTELDASSGLPRFNMPLELGLFLGARRFGDVTQQSKRCLVLDRQPYRYQAFISDIAGQDVESHDGLVGNLIERVRSFLNSFKRGKPLPSGQMIMDEFDELLTELPAICSGLDIAPILIDYADFVWIAAEFIAVHPTKT